MSYLAFGSLNRRLRMLWHWLLSWLLSTTCLFSNCHAQSASIPPALQNPVPNVSDSSHPNVIVILTDDQGWGDLSCHGNTNLSTRSIDLLSKSGARFDRFFVCPVCSPTRAEFLTGRFSARTGISGVSTGRERLNLDERVIAQDFKAAGYATACFGKWHNGSQYPYHPIARGFDEFYGFCSGHWGNYFSPLLDQNGMPVRGNGYIVDDITAHALRFIETHSKENFFLYLAIPTPHSPMQVPDKYWQRFKDRKLTQTGSAELNEDANTTRAALAMVENIDENVGQILSKLDALKISQNTIIVFFCDNGPNNDRWNDGMRGRKGSVDEGGVRSPLFISWPGKIKSNRLITQICSVTDLYPTLAELADIPMLNSKPVDGVSLTPLLTGLKSSLPDRVICSYWNGQTSARSQQYRLDAKDRLYDMVADPGQSRDLSTSLLDLTRELKAMRDQWSREVLDPAKAFRDRPFPVGHPDFHFTQLPARDGVPHGSVHRSAAAPNCSYFTGWYRTEDSLSWQIEVLRSGVFEAEVYYACPDSMVGSKIQLKFLDSSIQGEITSANDVPSYGSENDRVPRTSESNMKDFRPLRLGRIELAAGSDRLELNLVDLKAVEPIGGATESFTGVEISRLTLKRVR